MSLDREYIYNRCTLPLYIKLFEYIVHLYTRHGYRYYPYVPLYNIFIYDDLVILLSYYYLIIHCTCILYSCVLLGLQYRVVLYIFSRTIDGIFYMNMYVAFSSPHSFDYTIVLKSCSRPRFVRLSARFLLFVLYWIHLVSRPSCLRRFGSSVLDSSCTKHIFK